LSFGSWNTIVLSNCI